MRVSFSKLFYCSWKVHYIINISVFNISKMYVFQVFFFIFQSLYCGVLEYFNVLHCILAFIQLWSVIGKFSYCVLRCNKFIYLYLFLALWVSCKYSPLKKLCYSLSRGPFYLLSSFLILLYLYIFQNKILSVLPFRNGEV